MLHTIRTTLLLLFTALSAVAQAITELPVWQGYPGNSLEKTLVLPAVDSLSSVSATLYYDASGRVLADAVQPSVIKTSARNVLIRWSGPQSSSLAITNQYSYLKISVGGTVRFGVPVSISNRNVNITPSGSLTVVYPVPIQIPGSNGNGVSVQVYYRSNAHYGDVIVHNQGTRLVSVQAFHTGTDKPPDGLWSQVQITSDASVTLTPDARNEACDCSFVLTFFKPNPN